MSIAVCAWCINIYFRSLHFFNNFCPSILQQEDKTLFHEEFIHYLKYAMIVYRREPAVENVIEFAARFATCFQPAPKAEEEGAEQQQEDVEDDEEEDEEEEHPFLNFIFNFLLEVK